MKSSILKTALCAVVSSITLGLFSFAAQGVEVRYPTAAIDRPGIMPVGIISIVLGAQLKHLKTLGFGVNTEFGLANKLQGSLGWDGFSFDIKAKEKEVQVVKAVNLGLKYNYFSAPHISLSASIKAPFHVWDGEILRDLIFGLPTTFYNNIMAVGILSDFFRLTMRPQLAAQLDFNWWYGLQVYGDLWAELSSSFGRVRMVKGKKVEAVSVWKELPLTLNFIYAFNHHFDMGLNVGFTNAIKAKDTFNIGLNFTTRAGRLFG
jgi:hypothetical protein